MLLLLSHVILDILCLAPVQGHVKLQETGTVIHQHAIKVLIIVSHF